MLAYWDLSSWNASSLLEFSCHSVSNFTQHVEKLCRKKTKTLADSSSWAARWQHQLSIHVSCSVSCPRNGISHFSKKKKSKKPLASFSVKWNFKVTIWTPGMLTVTKMSVFLDLFHRLLYYKLSPNIMAYMKLTHCKSVTLH